MPSRKRDDVGLGHAQLLAQRSATSWPEPGSPMSMKTSSGRYSCAAWIAPCLRAPARLLAEELQHHRERLRGIELSSTMRTRRRQLGAVAIAAGAGCAAAGRSARTARGSGP